MENSGGHAISRSRLAPSDRWRSVRLGVWGSSRLNWNETILAIARLIPGPSIWLRLAMGTAVFARGGHYLFRSFLLREGCGFFGTCLGASCSECVQFVPIVPRSTGVERL